MVATRLVFNTSQPSQLPSEDLVLSAVNSLRETRESKLDKKVKLEKVTYKSKCFHFTLKKLTYVNKPKKMNNCVLQKSQTPPMRLSLNLV